MLFATMEHFKLKLAQPSLQVLCLLSVGVRARVRVIRVGRVRVRVIRVMG